VSRGSKEADDGRDVENKVINNVAASAHFSSIFSNPTPDFFSVFLRKKIYDLK
jgi:hypothetical protein